MRRKENFLNFLTNNGDVLICRDVPFLYHIENGGVYQIPQVFIKINSFVSL
jgi:hypothetical protein